MNSNMKKLGKNIIIVIACFLVISGLVTLYSADIEKVEDVSLSKLVNQINGEEVKMIEVEGSKLHVELKDGTKELSRKEADTSPTETFANLGVEKEKLQKIQIEVKDTSSSDFWLTIFLPFMLPFLLIAFFIWFLMRQAQRGSNQAMLFGSSRARMQIPTKDGKRKITFRDVAGCKEAKEELYEVVEFLRNPKKFLRLGARIPRGVLLLGSPGTGKTLMAKAVAGEANVPFFSISGSEFVEMFVGVGASRVRDLFKQAKKKSPAIVFIDEIDAVGRHRGAGLGGGHDEREQTLNQILVEMDGFDTDTNVIVIAATNRPDVLDPALLRPGRFDRRVTIDNPDIEEREAILKIHIKGKPLDKDIDLRQIAERTPGFSGADLENLVNEAAILAARRNKERTSMKEMREAIEKVLLGPERRSKVFSLEEKKITAYHEAGHALIAASLPKADPVQKISIISRGHAAGYTMNVPKTDRVLHFRSYYLDQLAVLMGGYVTEEMIFGEVTTGASNDLDRASSLARKLVTRFGMSKLGPMTFGKTEEMVFLGKELHDQKDYSEATAREIDTEAQLFIKQAHDKAKEVLSSKKSVLEDIVKALMKKETLEKDEFNKIVGIVEKKKEQKKEEKTDEKTKIETVEKKEESKQ
ncbi:MAG: ATP-dependent zinc metalloprotease FtsH [Patescibacteria group bacterium]|nr:ATP-dependent zinc metalloprotease FtsH [Patescibacteria group bacterium]